MIEKDILIQQLPIFLDSIDECKKVTLDDICQAKLKVLIPYLLEHKLEFLAFLSIDETKSLINFYDLTLRKQTECLTTIIRDEIIDCQAIFLQGFPRCLSLSGFISSGMRTDIDIFLPPENVSKFKRKIKEKGFDVYAYSDDDIFLVDKETEREFAKLNWAEKDFTLTLPFKIDLPDSLPVDFGDCYLPWLYRNEQWFMMISLEVHRSYIHNTDCDIISENSEIWPETGFFRCNLPSLIYFNLIRLYHGVLSGEKRLRLLLDTACLFKQPEITSCIDDIHRLVKHSSDAHEIRSLCASLLSIHAIFSPLKEISTLTDSSRNWLNAFYESITLNVEEA